MRSCWPIADALIEAWISPDTSASVQRSADRWVEPDFKWRELGSAGDRNEVSDYVLDTIEKSVPKHWTFT
jgi:hypothetical protein